MLNLNTRVNYFNLFIIAILGFSSGIPLALTGTALQAWLTQEGVSLVTIGLLGLSTQPYIYKFLWAPFIDRFQLPFLSLRRGWIFLMQLALVVAIIAIAFCDPINNPRAIGFFALLISLFSATQDIAFDAYRTELLKEYERGYGSVVYVYGYRIAMLVSGGGALLISHYIGWQLTYISMGLLLMLCSIFTLIAKEEINKSQQEKDFTTFADIIANPMKEFLQRPNAILLTLLLISYKLGEAFSFSLTTPFLITTLQFTTHDVGVVSKTMGLFATLIGLSIGGGLINKLGLYRSLFWFGVLQALAILLFVLLAIVGHNYVLMACTILVDQFASGLGTAALMVFLMQLCNKKYTAAQFALFSALVAMGRVYVLPISGYFVNMFGWEHFFIFSFCASLPSLFILKFLKKDINLHEISYSQGELVQA